MALEILVVDDDPDTREILQLVLGTLEIPIRLAHDGAQALQYVIKDPPLLMVLDLSMPGIGGEDVLEYLRMRHLELDMPILIYTAKALTDEQIEALQIPPDQILRKGALSMTQLREQVFEAVSKRVDID